MSGDVSQSHPATPVIPPNAVYRYSKAPDGVTTGSCEYCGKPHDAQVIPDDLLRSFDDRLGKAARKADTGSVAAAWIAVGRVQAELRGLLS